MNSLLIAILLQSVSGTNGAVRLDAPAFRDSDIYFIEHASTNFLVISNNGTNVVEIRRDGTVNLSAPPDVAAKEFWRHVQILTRESFSVATNRDEIIAVLKEANRWLSPDPTLTQLVYKTPATRLREEADASEAREKFMLRLSALIDKLSKP